MRSRARQRALLALLACGATVASVLVASPAEAAPHRVRIPGARPAWTSVAVDRGAAAADAVVTVEVGLDLQDEAGAEALATAVSTPGDPQYRHGLAPADWIARFAPTQAQVDSLTGSMTLAGLTVTTVPASRLFVLATGPASAMDSYFATTLHAYTSAGRTRYAAATPITLPGAVAADVAAIDFSHAVMTSRAVRASASSTATTCSTYWRQHTVSIPTAYGQHSASTLGCGYTAKQLRQLYGLDGASVAGTALDGSGQTIAVIDAFGSSTIQSDLATYSRRNGLPDADYTQTVAPLSTWDTVDCGGAAGWAGEQTLDLEAIHAVAPRAKLVYIGAADCDSGLDVALSTVLDNGLASIVSNSWGSAGLDTLAAAGAVSDQQSEQIVVNLHQHIQAAGEGIGLYFASGDAGDNAAEFGSAATDWPASSPWVTSVGGTTVGIDAEGRRVFTAAWGESIAVGTRRHWRTGLPGTFVQGAGGGRSSLSAEPWYQTGVVPASLSGGRRVESDVSALAALSTGFGVGMRVRGKYVVQPVGGTSLATPIVAAESALAQQIAGECLGFLNPTLYRVAAAGRTRDVTASGTRHLAVASQSKTSTVLVTNGTDSSLRARTGYDFPTGVGELTLASVKALAG